MKINNDSTFWCINCGNKGIPIIRKQDSLKKAFHRKKLYCLHCKKEMNMIECLTPFDIEQFKTAFANGDYLKEAKESMEFLENYG